VHESIYDGVLFLGSKCSVIRNMGFDNLCSALPLRVWEIPCSSLCVADACTGHVSHDFTHSSLANSRTVSHPFISIPIYYPLIILNSTVYRVSQEECARLREGVPYVKVYRYNPKYQCPKLNGYGDNGQRSLKL